MVYDRDLEMKGADLYHEFLYLSDPKVKQFVPVKASWWQRMRMRKISAKAKFTPVEVGLDVDLADVVASEERIRQLIEYLEESSVDYTDIDIEPGQWVVFEGRIGIAHLDAPLVPGLALFCEAEPITVTTPRIMLHGSARHVASSRLAPETADRPGGYSVSLGATKEILEALFAARGSGTVRSLRHFLNPPANEDTDFRQNLTTFFREVACSADFREFAPYLGGHARVTGVVHPPQLPFPVVLASPLYMRYERP
ncbi:SAVMC3_10250 family protein [Nocardia sp. NPDC059246]|uniref:SAVMC3_10250 family protein n=1 Tax=unclassified Nocardia TaxID=2637762 RepID=UPI0036CF63AD